MKTALLICVAAWSIPSIAQTGFPTMDSVDINNITAAVLVHGDMWWNPQTNSNYCEFPAHSRKNITSIGSIWMSGYDQASNLHIAAQTYRQAGIDYWPGPLDDSGNLNMTTSQNWAKIWKVNRTDVESFLALTLPHTVANTPPAILTWPGKGNIYAQGNGGVALNITMDMAPFVDVNGNGIYEPLLGDYPAFPGDQALWWVFSDNGPTHTETNGTPLGVEVHVMAYAFARPTLLADVVYYAYTIVNRSANNYSNFRIAQWCKPQIGNYYQDDYIGYDSTWRMAVSYNGTNCDGCNAGHPQLTYGLNPPQMAVTMVALPGDGGGSYVMPGNFTYYENDFSIAGNPTAPEQYDNYMRGKIADGESFTDDFRGAGMQSKGFGSVPVCNYVFPGDPSNNLQWSECASNNNPGDRRYVFSSNDFTLNAGQSQTVVLALLVADTAGGCPSTSFNDIKIVADTAWGNVQLLTVKNVAQGSGLKVYPNPAASELFIENTGAIGAPSIKIYNMIGQLFNVPVTTSGQKSVADISALPAGVYVVVAGNGSGQAVKFVKQ